MTDEGIIDEKILVIINGVRGTVAVLAPFVKVSCTDDAAAGVVAPITTVTVVALTYVHVATGPALAVAPTLAVQAKPAMKFVPVTVMVLPTYAAAGAMESAVGLAVTRSVVPVTATTAPPFVKVSCTDDAAAGVVGPITTRTEIASINVHDAAAMPVVAGAAPTLALQVPVGKFVPITVMVLPTYAARGRMEFAAI